MPKGLSRKVDVRIVNAFLKAKGIDPDEFRIQQLASRIRLKRKHKARIEILASGGAKVLVYLKHGRYVIRDTVRKFPFHDKELAQRASKAGKIKEKEVPSHV